MKEAVNIHQRIEITTSPNFAILEKYIMRQPGKSKMKTAREAI